MAEINDWEEVSPEQAEQPALEYFMQGGRKTNIPKFTQQQAEDALASVSGTANFASPLTSKLADFLMQKAVGIKKYLPGVGSKLIGEGVGGTRKMMTNQLDRKMQDVGGKISQEAAKVPATQASPALAELQKLKDSLSTPGGYQPAEAKPLLRQIERKISELTQEGTLTGTEQLARRKLSGRLAREAGAYKAVPSQAAKAKVLGTEQAGRSAALKQGYREAVPDNPEQLAELDALYSAMAQSKSALNKPQNMLEKAAGHAVKRVAAPAIGFAATGSPVGALAGAALATPAGMSATAHGVSKLGPAINRGLPGLIAPARSSTTDDEIDDWEEVR